MIDSSSPAMKKDTDTRGLAPIIICDHPCVSVSYSPRRQYETGRPGHQVET